MKSVFKKKDKRSTQELQGEYNRLALQSGNLQFVIDVQTKELKEINVKMRDLSKLYNDAKEAEKNVPAKTDQAEAQSSS